MGNTPHLTILNSTTLGESARWAEKDLWVLKQKDTEPRSADPLNYYSPHDPIVDFTKMVDHESLAHVDGEDYDGDLVIYFNVGAHHVPHSGDIPNTLMHTSASSVMFVSHNFNDRDPGRESVQGVRLQLKGSGSKSGGFAGESWMHGATPEQHGDLRPRTTDGKAGASAKYFGATYERDLKVSVEALEPRMDGYKVKEQSVGECNGSLVVGGWHREEAFGG
jgi:primary-amine oxidase